MLKPGHWTSLSWLCGELKAVCSLLQVVELLDNYGALNQGILAATDRLGRRGREVLKKTEGGLERLLPEFELMLIRVQSCFDYAD